MKAVLLTLLASVLALQPGAIGFLTIISKGCSSHCVEDWQDYYLGKKNVTCCSTDLCNASGAHALQPAIATLVLLIALGGLLLWGPDQLSPPGGLCCRPNQATVGVGAQGCGCGCGRALDYVGWSSGLGRSKCAALQCYSCKTQVSNTHCRHVQNCTQNETQCWTERIRECPLPPRHPPPLEEMKHPRCRPPPLSCPRFCPSAH
ncbi:PREDICTED: prostate stem cell antigen [Galeopterus variegatus]|uniref:Prostate stem cell antigen n=1 Tax=Galeopterus variegatus TaxID=482537 RepID=A0ABM0RLC0_GALVR|nr:PREDICTED: prostate stem cell antigen [Galeopterus variegatus]